MTKGKAVGNGGGWEEQAYSMERTDAWRIKHSHQIEKPRDGDVTKAPARRKVSQKTWDLKDDPTTAPETQTEQPKPNLEYR